MVKLRQEIPAGITAFFTVVYIVLVNSSILVDSGIPLEAGVVSTILASMVGCLLVGFIADAPILLVPGMGVNAFFAYTMVQNMGFTWQEALFISLLSGILFAVIVFTPLSSWFVKIIPYSLQQAMTIGIGLLLAWIGLQKGKLITVAPDGTTHLGSLKQPEVLLTLIGLFLASLLFLRKVPGHFLLSILVLSVLGAILGVPSSTKTPEISIASIKKVLFAFQIPDLTNPLVWVATYSLTLVLVVEHLGLIQSLVQDRHKQKRALQASALSVIASAILGTSPTVSAAESTTAIASGGKTGHTAITTGILFLFSFLLIPYLHLIPSSATAPILIIVGSFLFRHVQNLSWDDLSEAIPAFILLTAIPFTSSIPDGMAIGFLSYTIAKVATKQYKQLPVAFYFISLLFLIHLLLQ
jgi:AGZA family xanthine/uracil permease-like MFS transporter